MRSGPGSRSSSSRYEREAAGATYGAPVSRPLSASSAAALLRTETVSMCATVSPAHPSVRSGPSGLRARVGLSPKTPHQAAGQRIDPPASLPCAIGTSLAATAAPAPALEPPVERPRSQGLLVGPGHDVSFVLPSSELVLLPTNTSPAPRIRVTSSASWSSTTPPMNREPSQRGDPAYGVPTSL